MMGKTYKKDNNFKGFKPKKNIQNTAKTSLRFPLMKDERGSTPSKDELYMDYDEEEGSVSFEKFTKKR